ncbi:hypothetical protein [Paraburkholderia sp. 7MH5]|uniref:hypothetical protein n=1 Tax=Paraburkholderia pallida TaxID=2547399 RepID=UPI00142F6B21
MAQLIRGVRGRPIQTPMVIYADRDYDCDFHHQELRWRGFRPVITKRCCEY